MARKPPPASRPEPGLPSKQQVLDFIKDSPTEVGKREIARTFGLKGQEKIKLKALLKDMADEGLIDGRKSAYHEMGGLPKVTVLRVIDIEDGEPVAVPDTWSPEDKTPPPRVRLVERKGKMPALRKGERVLARTEETRTGWIAHPMKKLPVREDQVLGVVENRCRGQGMACAHRSPDPPCVADHRSCRGRGGPTRDGRACGSLATCRRQGYRGAGRSAGPTRFQPHCDPQIRHSACVRTPA